MYAVIGEGLSSEAEELVTHFLVTCNDKASVVAAKYLTYREVPIAAVTAFKG